MEPALTETLEERWKKVVFVKRRAMTTMLSNRGIYLTRGRFNKLNDAAGHYHRRALEASQRYETLAAGRNMKDQITQDYEIYLLVKPLEPGLYFPLIVSRTGNWPREVVDLIIERYGINQEEFIESYFENYAL